MKRKLRKRTSIYDYSATLMEEWHWEKNNALDLDPLNLSWASNQKVWWKCKKCGHEWFTAIGVRSSKKMGCPKCKVQKRLSQIAISHRLDVKYPEIASEWHPTKNGNLTAHDVGYACHKKVWWKCFVCGCEWYTAVRNRTASINARSGCISCKSKNK